MTHPELLILSILRALVEVALLTLLGQGILALLAGARRHTNPIYALFLVVTRPVMRALRLVTPKAILDRHLPFVAFFLLFWLWIALAWLKRASCRAQGLVC
ncbi:MAG: hypothetical protein JNM82_11080 [Rhodocyclaceae bacterium]|nr:hypothetical protein [Rhodocyclaceae bacterium]